MRPVTDIERDTLRYLYWYQRWRGYMPTLRELASAFGLVSTNAASCRLRHLERKGCLNRGKKLARAIGITERGMQALGRLDDPWPFFDVEKSA